MTPPAPPAPPPASRKWSLLEASEPQRARYATLLMAVMLAVTHAVFAWSLPAVVWSDPRSVIPHVTFAPLVAAVLVFTLAKRRMSLRLARALFGTLALLALPNMIILDTVMSSQGRPWVPFIGERTVLLGLGLFSPLSAAANVALVALYLAASWLQWNLQLRELQPLASWTPGVTTAWGLLTLGLLLYRRYVNAALAEMARTRSEVETLRSAARTLLVVRDGVNTPLQTIALGLALLERHPERTAQVLPTLLRAHAQVRELMQHSAEVEDPLRHWDAEELSPDPHLALERLREDLARLSPAGQILH